MAAKEGMVLGPGWQQRPSREDADFMVSASTPLPAKTWSLCCHSLFYKHGTRP